MRRIALASFVLWAAFVFAALRLAALDRGPESPLRIGIALLGTAIAMFAVLRAGEWPRLLYMLAAGYFGYFAAASEWRGLWPIAAVPAEGWAETLAIAFELGVRLVLRQAEAGSTGSALALAYDLALMPVAQLVVGLSLARRLLAPR